MDRLKVAVFLAMSIAVKGLAQASPAGISSSSGEQHSIDQLRSVVEGIKTCQPLNMPLSDDMEAEGFSAVQEPPVNVVWNVELHPSVRSQYEGSIEFSEPSYFKVPSDTSYCNKPRIDKNACKRMWSIGMDIYKRQIDHPQQFKYEFDVTDHGLEFTEAFTKTKQMDGEPWVAGGMDSNACAYLAIKKAMTSLPPVTLEVKNHPTGVPENLWIAANGGDTDALFYMGGLYQKGENVPQDYVEAYFWLNIAASGKSQTVPHEEVIKARDEVASHLTSELLLRTQERARKWVENHPKVPAEAIQP